MTASFDQLCHMAKIELQCYEIEHDVRLNAKDQLEFLYEKLISYMKNYVD